MRSGAPSGALCVNEYMSSLVEVASPLLFIQTDSYKSTPNVRQKVQKIKTDAPPWKSPVSAVLGITIYYLSI